MSTSDLTAEFRALSDDDLINDQPKVLSFSYPLMIGLTAICLSLGSLVAWSCVAHISSAVIVPGTVVVATGSKAIQHPTGGTVKSIDVEEGQEVRAGQIVMRLDPAVLRIDRDSINRLLAINGATLARLRAERDRIGSIDLDDKIGKAVDSETWKTVKLAQSQVFQARQSALMEKVGVLESDSSEALAVSRNIIEQEKSQRTRIELTEQELATASEMAKVGYGTRQRVLEIRRALAELQSDLSSLEAKRIDAVQSSEHDRLEEKQQESTFLESVALELQSTDKENVELSLKLGTVDEQLASLNIRSPASGRIVNLSVHTVGGVVMAGETISEVVPAADTLMLEAEIRPDDMEDVAVGLPVDVRLSGVRGGQAPRLVGKITLISADRIRDPQRSEPYFRVRAELSKDQLGEAGLSPFKPGQSVMLMIRHGDHTPLEYLVSPLLDFFKRALH